MADQKLRVPRFQAGSQLQDLVARGVDLKNSKVTTQNELDKFEIKMQQWRSYSVNALQRVYVSDDVVAEFQNRRPGSTNLGWKPPEWFQYHIREINHDIGTLNSLIERLEFFESPRIGDGATTNRCGSDKVFIVHGHDEVTKLQVTDLVRKLGLKPIVLVDRTNAGRTIIEKVEAEDEVLFAIVLLTPDDVGAAKDDANRLRQRARQNVILEFGYFLGRLGRRHVCCLYHDGVELPSDMSGIAYVSLDPTGAWKLNLAREIKQVRPDIDLNRLHD